MIVRIELENFMAHAHTVIEPAAGLTVLVGPNNCGKSAVVSALQILCENAPGDYMVRHGEKECVIAVVTDDGHRIEWRRRGSVVSYVLDGQAVHRLGGGIPEELHSLLRLAKVQAADNRDSYDVHFGLQKSPIFLLHEPGSRAATFFAASSDAEKLIAMQGLHRDKTRRAAQEEKRLSPVVQELTNALEVLAPVGEIQRRLEEMQLVHQSLLGQAAKIAVLTGAVDSLVIQAAAVEGRSAQARAMFRLEPPPPQHRLVPLERIMQQLAATEDDAGREGGRMAALALLADPPQLRKTAPLERLAGEIGEVTATMHLERRRSEAAQALAQPPVMGPAAMLARLCDQMDDSGRQLAHFAWESNSLRAVTPPPLQRDEGGMAALLQRCSAAESAVVAMRAQTQTLDHLPAPPAVADVARLQAALRAFEDAITGVELERQVEQTLANVVPVERPQESAPLARTVADIAKSLQEVADCQADGAAAQVELARAEEALRQWAQLNRTCPVCGAEIDPASLISQSAVRAGGHPHV